VELLNEVSWFFFSVGADGVTGVVALDVSSTSGAVGVVLVSLSSEDFPLRREPARELMH
jgi:hypothetical protein